MKHALRWVGLAWFAACGLASAQIEVRSEMAHARHIQYETVKTRVMVSNQSGEAIVLDHNSLGCSVQKTPGQVVVRKKPLIAKPVVVESGQSRVFELNLSGSFDFRETGPYTIRHYVTWGGEKFHARPHFVDVVPGFRLKVLRAGDPNMPTRVHQFTLLTLNRDRGDRLFLRIEDTKRSHLFGVYHLGRMIRVSAPEMRLDSKGNLHVNHQTSPSKFLEHEFSFTGEFINQTVITPADSQPRELPESLLNARAERNAKPKKKKGWFSWLGGNKNKKEP